MQQYYAGEAARGLHYRPPGDVARGAGLSRITVYRRFADAALAAGVLPVFGLEFITVVDDLLEVCQHLDLRKRLVFLVRGRHARNLPGRWVIVQRSG